MCGIWGTWHRDHRPLDAAVVQGSVATLRHRGPDDEGILLLDSRTGGFTACGTQRTDRRLRLPDAGQALRPGFDIAMGQTRLSVLDLSVAGHQPMSSADGRLHITFNGEVFNYRELRDELKNRGHEFRSGTDTEVVLAAYRQWGVECLSRFNGMWAFALWDNAAGRFFLARDRFGVKPLVYHETPERLVFSSECDAVIEDPAVPRDLDPEALHHYLSMMVVPAPFTIYRAVSRLAPGHYIMASVSGLEVRQWYRVPVVEEVPMSEADAIAQAETLLQDAIRLRLQADVPVGSFLSGGVDSSVVSAIAASGKRTGALRTFSVGFPGTGALDESPWARKVAKHIGSDHAQYELAPDFPALLDEFSRRSDEPFASPSVIGVYLLSREANKNVKVVLTGDGGDETFAGYTTRHVGIDQRWSDFKRRPFGWLTSRTAVDGWNEVSWGRETLPERLLRRIRWERLPDQTVRDLWYIRTVTQAATDAEKRCLYTPDWGSHVGAANTQEWLLSRLPPAGQDRLSRWQSFDFATTLANEMLAKVDRATMAWGLEARTPLLDYRLVEFALSLPRELKVREQQGKHVLKRLSERYVPADVLYREKQGFTVPLSHWLGKSLKPFVERTLSPERLARHGIFGAQAVARLMEESQGRPRESYTSLLFNLMCFQLWFEARTGASG